LVLRLAQIVMPIVRATTARNRTVVRVCDPSSEMATFIG
jgi:hypothetical protein